MARRKKFMVSVKWSNKNSAGLLIEQLRYAGVIRHVQEAEGGMTFDIPCPAIKDVDSFKWAEQNSKRMASFSIPARVVEE